MDRQAIAPIGMRYYAQALLVSIQANTLFGAGFKVKLFTAGPSPITQYSSIADFTEATFGGYAALTPALGDFAYNVNFPNANGMMNIYSGFFIAAGITPPGETVLGYYVEDFAGTGLVMAELFNEPVDFANDGDFLELMIALPVALVGNIQ